MNLIAGLDRAKELLGEFHFSEFRIIRELRFFEDDEDFENYGLPKVDLIIESNTRSQNYRMKIRFSGVCNLRVKDFGSTQTGMCGFYINDLTDRQWENLSLEAGDYENDRIFLQCMKAEILFLEKVT